jgi:hypothetical protein
MGFSAKSKKSGKTYFLHAKGHLHFFSSKAAGGCELPAGMKVIENAKTGLPLLKKK